MVEKIGIISDTHGLLRPKVKEILKGCDYILHAGDVDRPELLDELRPLGSVYVVRGNTDGHSHKYFCGEIDGRLWLNPGSCGYNRFGSEVTMAVMTVENGKWSVEKILL